MYNLYNKIYEAVNTGIQKALILDPDNDVSIKWHEKNKVTEFNVYKYYVEKLITPDIERRQEYFDEIMLFYNKGTQKYKINNFIQLIIICFFIKNLHNTNIDWIDTSDIISILTDSTEIPFDDFRGNNARFIKLKNAIGEHDLILHTNLMLSNKLEWEIDEKISRTNFNDSDCIKTTDNAFHDYNGYSHTYNNYDITIHNTDINDNNYPAFDYCFKLNNIIDKSFEAYLPSSGELFFIWQAKDLINYILTKVNNSPLYQLDFNKDIFWTSTEQYFRSAYHIRDGILEPCLKNFKGKVLPLFKKIK